MHSHTTTESIQNIVQNISAAICVLLNLFLIFLIIKKSPSLIGSYRYLMIYISINEALYSIATVLVSPITHHTGYTFLVISRLDNFNFPPDIQLALVGAYCGLFGASMATFGIHFIYRYLVITGNSLVSTFRSWKALVWMSIPLIYGFIWGFIAVVFCGPRKDTDLIIAADILEELDLELEHIVYIAPNLRNEHGGVYWPAAIGLLVDCFIMTSSFLTVTIFCHKCFNALRALTINHNISSKSKSLQHQLYFALVSQTLIPVILMQIPCFGLFLSAFFPVNIGKGSSLVAIAISIYPAIDPLPTMLIVTSYRRAIAGYARGIKKRMMKLWSCSREKDVVIPPRKPEISETRI